jgi:hypothetical protein
MCHIYKVIIFCGHWFVAEDIVDVLITPSWVQTMEDFDLDYVSAKVTTTFYLLADHQAKVSSSNICHVSNL